MDVLNQHDGEQTRQGSGFFGRLFGPKKKVVWKQLAERIGAKCVDGGFFRGCKVIAKIEPWTAVLDTYTVPSGESSETYTRIRAAYLNPDGFKFTVYQASIFTGLGEWMGFEDIKIGELGFDDAFVVKGNNPDKVRKLLADLSLRDMLRAQKQLRLEVTHENHRFGEKFPEGVDALCYTARGVVRDIDRLQGAFEIFERVLHRLVELGSAVEADPNYNF